MKDKSQKFVTRNILIVILSSILFIVSIIRSILENNFNEWENILIPVLLVFALLNSLKNIRTSRRTK